MFKTVKQLEGGLRKPTSFLVQKFDAIKAGGPAAQEMISQYSGPEYACEDELEPLR